MQTDINPEMTGCSVVKKKINQNMMGKLPQNCCLHGNKSVYFAIFKFVETLTD